METTELSDDAQVRAMVALLEAQSAQIASLQDTVQGLLRRLSARHALDAVMGGEVRHAVDALRRSLAELELELDDPSPGDSAARRVAARAARDAGVLAARVEELLAPPVVAPVQVRREVLQDVRVTEIVERAVAGLPALDPTRVVVRTPPRLVLLTSPVRLAAVVGMLLDNAVRHGGEGPVACVADVVDDDVFIHVIDSGPGFDEHELGRAAEAAGDDALADGRGVGLYLARMLARSLGGDLVLANAPAGGAVATVVVPQRRGSDQPSGW